MHILLEISKLKIITGSNSSTPLFNFLTTTNPLSSKEIYFIIIDTMNEFDGSTVQRLDLGFSPRWS
jgi:hypothetical protein